LAIKNVTAGIIIGIAVGAAIVGYLDHRSH
jgi:hypothetical protein